MCRAMRAKDLTKLKEDVKKCFEAAAISTRCTLKITDKMNYKGPPLHPPESPFYLASRARTGTPRGGPMFFVVADLGP